MTISTVSMEPDAQTWNCACNLLIESLERPDHELRSKAKEVGCYDEMMWLRNEVESWVREQRMKE